MRGDYKKRRLPAGWFARPFAWVVAERHPDAQGTVFRVDHDAMRSGRFLLCVRHAHDTSFRLPIADDTSYRRLIEKAEGYAAADNEDGGKG